MKKLLFTSLALVFGLLLIRPSFSAQEVVSEDALQQLNTLAEFHTCEDYEKQDENNEYCDTVQKKGSVESRFENIRTAYHSEANSAFNALFTKLAKTSFQTDQNRDRTAEQTEFAGVYVSRQLELKAYTSALETLKKSNQLCANSSDLVEEALKCAYGLKEQITFEQITAEKALRITLSSYAEMRLLYPLHAEFENLISETKDLRDMWEKFITQIARMPAKFINAASQ